MLTLVLTVGCAIGAAVVLALGLIRRLAEVALLGSVLWVVSILPFAHGLLLPGHLYGPNPGSSVAIMAAVPAALLAGLPVVLDGTPGRRPAGTPLAALDPHQCGTGRRRCRRPSRPARPASRSPPAPCPR